MAKKPGAHQSRAHHERAQAAYDNITSQTQEGEPAADLKSLIAGIKAAQQRKAQTQKRIGKKQVQRAKEQLTREQRMLNLKEKVLDEEYKREQARARIEEQRTDEQRTNLQVALRDDPKRDKHYELGVEFSRMYNEMTDVIDAKESQLTLLMQTDLVILDRMWRDLNMTARQITQLSSTLFSEEVVHEEEQKFKLLLQKVQPRLRRLQEAVAANRRLLENSPSNLPVPAQTVQAARPASAYKPKGAVQDVTEAQLVKSGRSSSLMRLMGMFGRGVANIGVAGTNALIGGGKVVSNRMAGLAARSVAVVASAGKAISTLGDRIKDVKDNGAEWMKKVGDLFSYVRRKWTGLKSGASAGAGMLGQLLGLGMLFDSLIKPIFQQLNTELEARFGKDYVNKFMTSMWEKAKTWLFEGIKNIFIPKAGSAEEKTQKDMHVAAKAVVSGDVAKAMGTAGFGGKLWDTVKNGADSNKVIWHTLNEFNDPKTSAGQKSFDKTYIENMLKARKAKNWAIPVSLASMLKGSGFSVDGLPTVQDGARSQAAAAPGTAVGSARSFQAAGPTVNVAPVKLNTAPIVAAVPPRTASAPAPTAKTAAKAPTAPGSGASMISNQGVSDFMEALNHRILGAH